MLAQTKEAIAECSSVSGSQEKKQLHKFIEEVNTRGYEKVGTASGFRSRKEILREIALSLYLQLVALRRSIQTNISLSDSVLSFLTCPWSFLRQ